MSSFSKWETIRSWRLKSNTMKSVLWAMVSYGNDEGEGIRPALDTIAEECDLTTRSVRSAVLALVEAGALILIAEPAGKPKVYRCPLANPPSSIEVRVPKEKKTPERASPLNDVHPLLPVEPDLSPNPGNSFTPETLSPLNVLHPTPEAPSPNPLISVKERKKEETPDPLSPLRVHEQDVKPAPPGTPPLLNVLDSPPDLAAQVLAILEEIPMCNRSPEVYAQEKNRNLRLKGIREFIAGPSRSNITDENWLEIARWCRDDKSTRPAAKENATFEMAPSRCLSDTFAKAWAEVQRNNGIQAPQRLIERAEVAPADMAVMDRYPELWAAVELMFRRWYSTGVSGSKPTAAKVAGYTAELSDVGITAELITKHEKEATRGAVWAIPAEQLAQLIISVANTRRAVVILSEEAELTIREKNIQKFGKPDVSLQEIRTRMKQRLGLHDQKQEA